VSKTLLIVHHTPSPHCQEMFEAVVAGATDPDIEDVEVVRRPALTVSPVEMLEADGYVLGTPANLGYVSGAMKHYLGEYLLAHVGPASGPLLIVHHTPSPHCQEMFEAVVAGATDPEIEASR
jgi:hypothetical protein